MTAPLSASPFVLVRHVIANAPLINFAFVQAPPRVARADPETGLLPESLMFRRGGGGRRSQD